jgi:carbon monoxide dehydrogenase subunit G
MRTEGTYTFAAPIERVFAALADPTALARALPGCERVMQIGPAGEDGAAAFDLRLRTDDGHAASVSLRPTSARRPTHLGVELSGYGPLGTMTGHGHIDLVDQDEHTVGAYVWDVDLPALPAERSGAATAAGQRLARDACERLGEYLRSTAPLELHAETLNGRPAVRVEQVQTPRGRIVTLRAVLPALPSGTRIWAQRALWMGAGLALGIGTIAATVAVLHRLLGDERTDE